MIYYLNFGFILEQALQDVIKIYLDRQRFDDVYGNFHISVVNQHPFAHMIVDSKANCSDSFPSVVITSQSDSKPNELINMPVQAYGIGFTASELAELETLGKRNKKKIDANGELVDVTKGGVVQTERIPGFVYVHDSTAMTQLKTVANSRTVGTVAGQVYGIKLDTRRRDHVSIEIWAENNQIKNEIYEHLRLLLESSLDGVLNERYKMFNTNIVEGSIHGERSSNFNFDFDTVLCGSHIAFDVDYSVSQIIIDSTVTNADKEIITEVLNHVEN